MSLFGKKEQEEIARLQAEISRLQGENAQLRAQLTPEHMELADLKREIEGKKNTLSTVQQQIQASIERLARLKDEIVETDETVLLQSFGLYTPYFNYATSDEYKQKLKAVRDQQKLKLKVGTAATGNMSWTVNGSLAEGKKMVQDTQKLLLRAFNAECDDAIEHVRFNNIEACRKKIRASANAISKLGSMMGIAIEKPYVKLKVDELNLMYEYQVKKQQEKEEQKEARQRQREEAKAQKELEEARKKLDKEQNHYSNELSRLNNQLAAAKSEAEVAALEDKKREIESRLGEIDKQIQDVDYRAANQRAGYVYVISNIGAFGEDVYKIGMTRRLNPMERVDELGGASVPFNFDVHALIFSEDAPKLEAALHSAFEDKKLNFVNRRREFFRVTLDEIKKVIRENYDKTVEFVDVAPAEQYRESLKMKENQETAYVGI